MIIRRRTYIKLFTDRYGYFMRNFNYNLGNSNYSEGINLATNIYTKCMQKEVPVGVFPLSFRQDTYAVSSSGGHPRYVAIGGTDGSVIYVVTAKSIYKSIDGGASFSKVTTNWNSSAYVSAYTGPIVYVDDSYLYIVYTEINYINDSSCNYTLMLVKVSRSSNNVVSTTALDTIYLTWNSGEGNFTGSPFDNGYGAFFSLNASPKGQIMIFYKVYSNRRTWKIYDLPRGVASGLITQYNTAGTTSYDMWEASGEWINDNTTYGKFFFCGSELSSGTPIYRGKYYKTVASSQFSAGASLTVTDITSALGTIVSDHLAYWDDTSLYPGQPYGAPRIFIASCLKTYKNKLFIYGFEGSAYDYYAYSCDASFGNKVEIPIDHDRLNSDTHNRVAELSGQICGICVTPDGNYGVVLWNYAAITLDLINNCYYLGYPFMEFDDNGCQPIRSNESCFMLPKTVK